MCIQDQANELERDFLNILDDYRSWQQNQNQLLLFARSGDVFVFSEITINNNRFWSVPTNSCP
jgi:heat shock protein HslJ